MRLLISSLTIAVFLNSVELSSQAFRQPPHGHGPTPPGLMELPQPYYYNKAGEIKKLGMPQAHAVMDGDLFLGMANVNAYFPIEIGDKFYILNIKEHRKIELSHDEVIYLMRGETASHNTPGASSSSRGPPSVFPG